MSKYDIRLHKYVDGRRVAVEIIDEEGPYTWLSINVPEVLLSDNEFILNHDLLSPLFQDFRKKMLESGNFQDTGRTCSYGFCKNVPIWKLLK